MKRDSDTITLPSYWATAIVNGDYTGFTDDGEAARCEAVIDAWAAKGWDIIDVARNADGEPNEPRFTWQYRLYDTGANCTGGEVLDYTIMKRD